MVYTISTKIIQTCGIPSALCYGRWHNEFVYERSGKDFVESFSAHSGRSVGQNRVWVSGYRCSTNKVGKYVYEEGVEMHGKGAENEGR